MTAITNQDPNISYKALLTCGVTGSGSTLVASGITGSIQIIQDALGSNSALGLSTSQVNCANITFNGNTVNTTSGAITITPNVTFNGAVTFNGSISGLTITNPFMAGSFTVTLGGSLTTSGAYSTTITVTNTTNVTLPTSGTLSTLAGSETLTNKTLTAPVISSIINTGMLTLPTSSDTLVGRATTDTLTNKTLTTPTITSPVLNGTISGSGIIPLTQGGSGYANGQQVVQRKQTSITSLSGTATFTFNNSVPQNTSGAQLVTLTITPLNASNRLRIHFNSTTGSSGTFTNLVVLFQDSIAGGLAYSQAYIASSAVGQNLMLTYDMPAGTTSATTFKIRAGSNGGTWYIGNDGQETFGLAGAGGLFEIVEYTP